MEFLLPPRTKNWHGHLRRVGFEIEFGGISLEEAVQIIVNAQGGSVRRRHHFSFWVCDTRVGNFVVESDSRFLSEKKYDHYLSQIGVAPQSSITGNVERVLDKISRTLLPFEIAMPPLPLDHLQAAEEIRRELHRRSAQGTRSSLFSAFGMQINAEVPDCEVHTLLSYLRAFFLLYDWLEQEAEVVWARKLAPFIHPFSQEYIQFVLNPAYDPDLTAFMMDYLSKNPTRNRPLDLLPLFAELDQDLVFRYPVERNLIKARPAFHYRLPNSEIDDPEWSFAKEWNKWVQVEKLADDPKRISGMSEDYLRIHGRRFLTNMKTPWISKTREWMGANV